VVQARGASTGVGDEHFCFFEIELVEQGRRAAKAGNESNDKASSEIFASLRRPVTVAGGKNVMLCGKARFA